MADDVRDTATRAEEDAPPEEDGASSGAPPVEEDTPPEDAADPDDVAEEATERDYLDDLRRLQADFENYKKRMVRQQTEHLERAAEALVAKLLPVLDAGDLAMAHGGAEGEAVAQVVGMLADTLVKEGLEPLGINSGDAFDPNEHDAVAHEPADGDDGPVVIEVLREGYRYKGRLLRPAMVRVKG